MALEIAAGPSVDGPEWCSVGLSHEGPGACVRPVGGRTCGLPEDKVCAPDHNLWRNYTHVATRCRGTLDLSPDICKTPNRRVAVTSPVTLAPWGTEPEPGLKPRWRAGVTRQVGRISDLRVRDGMQLCRRGVKCAAQDSAATEWANPCREMTTCDQDDVRSNGVAFGCVSPAQADAAPSRWHCCTRQMALLHTALLDTAPLQTAPRRAEHLPTHPHHVRIPTFSVRRPTWPSEAPAPVDACGNVARRNPAWLWMIPATLPARDRCACGRFRQPRPHEHGNISQQGRRAPGPEPGPTE